VCAMSMEASIVAQQCVLKLRFHEGMNNSN
jgi:hypothetical protein